MGLTDEINGENEGLNSSSSEDYKAGTTPINRGYKEVQAAYRAEALIYCPGP